MIGRARARGGHGGQGGHGGGFRKVPQVREGDAASVGELLSLLDAGLFIGLLQLRKLEEELFLLGFHLG